MRSKLAFALVFAGVWACSTYGEDLPSPPDAGADALDSGTAVDSAGIDAAPDAAPEPFGLGPVTYDATDDFNRGFIGNNSPFGWEEKVVGPASPSLALVPCERDKLCEGQVLRCQNDGASSRFLLTALAPSTRVVRFDFALQVNASTPGATQEVQLASFEFGAQDHFVFVDYRDGRIRLADQAQTQPGVYDTEVVDVAEVPLGQWSQYRFYLNLETGEAALSVDGRPARQIVRVDQATPLRAARLGITYVVDGAFDLRYDNVGLKQN